MTYTHAEHPIFWEMTHHPVVALVVAVVLAVAVLSLYAAGPVVGPEPIAGMEFVP